MLKETVLTLLTAAQTRLQLLGNEVQVEKYRFLGQLRLILALTCCFGLLLLLVIGLALSLWWEARVTVLTGAIGIVVVLAGYFYVALQRLSSGAEALFAVSLAEVQEDLHQLAAARDEQRPG